jgi:hypothetical protein
LDDIFAPVTFIEPGKDSGHTEVIPWEEEEEEWKDLCARG